jgi:hypothetical protein
MLVSRLVLATMIAVAIPLVFKKAARNPEFRTTNTMSPDLAPVSYRANRIAWIAVLVAGIFWLAVALLLPRLLQFWLAYRE